MKANNDLGASSPEPDSETVSPASAVGNPLGTVPSWLVTLVAGLVAGSIAWGLGESRLVRVEARKVPMVTMGQKHEGTTPATEQAAVIATASRNAAAFGALLGLAMGAAGSVVRRRGEGGMRAALSGAVLGGVAGGLATFLAVNLHARVVSSFEDDLIPSLIMHGAIATAIGAAAGFAFGLGAGAGEQRGRLNRTLIGGAVGGLLGATAYQILGGLWFPIDGTTEPVPATAVARFVSPILVSASTAIGVIVGYGRR